MSQIKINFLSCESEQKKRDFLKKLSVEELISLHKKIDFIREFEEHLLILDEVNQRTKELLLDILLHEELMQIVF